MADNSATVPGGTRWHRVAAPDELAEDSVKMVKAGSRLIALIRSQGRYGALDNTCPHSGGPLGQGSIENGLLVCPWHGREYHPLTGECEGYAERAATYPVEARDDGVYVAV